MDLKLQKKTKRKKKIIIITKKQLAGLDRSTAIQCTFECEELQDLRWA